mmetsp:Transcript_135899/g.433788  ORF Transcript_135899/g.433788 Transcript_135899/m.433788 type:complete len:282 (+) Transcript_135899:421-1266(+)
MREARPIQQIALAHCPPARCPTHRTTRRMRRGQPHRPPTCTATPRTSTRRTDQRHRGAPRTLPAPISDAAWVPSPQRPALAPNMSTSRRARRRPEREQVVNSKDRPRPKPARRQRRRAGDRCQANLLSLQPRSASAAGPAPAQEVPGQAAAAPREAAAAADPGNAPGPRRCRGPSGHHTATAQWKPARTQHRPYRPGPDTEVSAGFSSPRRRRRRHRRPQAAAARACARQASVAAGWRPAARRSSSARAGPTSARVRRRSPWPDIDRAQTPSLGCPTCGHS